MNNFTSVSSTLKNVNAVCFEIDIELMELILLNSKLFIKLEHELQTLNYKQQQQLQPQALQPKQIQPLDSKTVLSASSLPTTSTTAPPTSTTSSFSFIYDVTNHKKREQIQKEGNQILPFHLSSPLPSSIFNSSTQSWPQETSSCNKKNKKNTCLGIFKKLFKCWKAKTKKENIKQAPTSPFDIKFNYAAQFQDLAWFEEGQFELPIFLILLFHFINQPKILQQKGIFRLSSNVEKCFQFFQTCSMATKEVLENILSNPSIFKEVCLEPCDLLKKWLRQIPGCLFPKELNENLQYISKLDKNDINTCEKLKASIFLLDETSQKVLKYILLICKNILKHCSSNYMDEQCLARTIGLNLFSLESTSLNSFDWSMDIFKILLSKDVDFWFTIPCTH